MLRPEISFSHIINPFPAPDGSEHHLASQLTYAALRRAVEAARVAGISVEVRAVVLAGDERAIEMPATPAEPLTRTVQDIRPLKPPRPLPLIGDILRHGANGASGNYLVFTNMDIVVTPQFYAGLQDIALNRLDEGVPFIVYRRNVPARYKRIEQLDELYGEKGEVAYGFDCFVFPARYVGDLDLGDSCIGSAHFDNLLFMALDAVSGFRMSRVNDVPLTFHIGNEIEWSRHIDYIEHNLHEALSAIERMQRRYNVPADGNFANMMRNHFIPNARIDSMLFRKVKRLPGLGIAVHRIKKWIGRSH